MEENNKEGTITIKKDSLWKYSTFGLLAILVIGAVVFILPDNPSPTGNVVAGDDVPTEPAQATVSIDDDAVLGDPNAPVTIVEFSDYQCPFCRKFWADTLPQIKSEYIDTGKVKFVYRDFPLSFHAMAQPSAEAAECVRKQGGDEAYYEFHDKLFEEQMILDGGVVSSTVSYTTDDIKAWASELGYDIASCLDSGEFKAEVQKDMADGQKAGIRGTPGSIVLKSGESSGTIVSGAVPFEQFKQVIDSKL